MVKLANLDQLSFKVLELGSQYFAEVLIEVETQHLSGSKVLRNRIGHTNLIVDECWRKIAMLVMLVVNYSLILIWKKLKYAHRREN